MTKAKTLRDCALIVRLSIPRWNPTRADKRGAEIVKRETNGNGAAEEIGEYRKYRIPRKEVDPIRKAADTARTYHYANTLPWQDGGFRLLSVAQFDDYMHEIERYRQEYLDSVAEFIERYPRLVEEAADRLGSMYDPADYPTAAELTERFDFRMKASQISESPDLRSDMLDPEILDRLRDDMRRDIEDASRSAQRDLWSRMFEIAKRLAETLGDTDKIFRDSLVTRSDEILTTLGALNVFDDPKIERVRADLQGILQNDEGRPINPDTFRYHSAKQPGGARVEGAKQAKASMAEVAGILKKFGI